MNLHDHKCEACGCRYAFTVSDDDGKVTLTYCPRCDGSPDDPVKGLPDDPEAGPD